MHITDSDFDVPTTIDEFGKRLYAVNARFTTPPTADTDYWLAKFRKVSRGH
jgi:G:T-mismatch repair DNA endonuclease (very short patch repair protein)